MPDMLRMSAFQLGNPMALLVLSEVHNSANNVIHFLLKRDSSFSISS